MYTSKIKMFNVKMILSSYQFYNSLLNLCCFIFENGILLFIHVPVQRIFCEEPKQNIYEIQDLLAFWNNGISRIFKTCVFSPFKKHCADKVCIITFKTKKF